MGPGIEKLKEMHTKWEQKKKKRKVRSPKRKPAKPLEDKKTRNTEQTMHLIDTVLSGKTDGLRVTGSRRAFTFLSGLKVRSYYRPSDSPGRLRHKITIYNDTLERTGFERGDLVVLLHDEASNQAVIAPAALVNDRGYTLQPQSKTSSSLFIEITDNKMPRSKDEVSISLADLIIRPKAIAFVWPGR